LSGMEDQFIGLLPDLLEGVSGEDLHEAFLRATAPKPELDLFHVTSVKLTVAETVEYLIEELPQMGRVTLRELTSAAVDRVEVVVYFLSVLELYKQGVIDLTQIATFGTLTIEWLGVDTETGLLGIDAYEG